VEWLVKDITGDQHSVAKLEKNVTAVLDKRTDEYNVSLDIVQEHMTNGDHYEICDFRRNLSKQNIRITSYRHQRK
jgi:hypothetical protein